MVAPGDGAKATSRAGAAGLSQPVSMTVVMLATALIATVGVWGGARALNQG